MVPTASASSARPARGSFPSRKNSPCSHTPTSVPTLSNRSTKKNTQMISIKPMCTAPTRSSFIQVPRPLAHPAQHSRNRGGDNSQQNRSADAAHQQNRREDQTEHGDLHFVIRKTTQAHKRRRLRHHQFRVAQTHEGNEKANARRGAEFQAVRYAVDDLFANPGKRQQQKQRAGDKHDAESRLP